MDDPNQAEGPGYAYKPSLMGAPWFLRLTPEHLAWAIGRRSGQLAYRDIATIRMSFRPVTMQARRFLTEIRGPGAPKIVIASASWKSLMEQGQQSNAYSDFVAELHARVAAAGGWPRCGSGLHPLLYWPGVVVFVGVLLALAALIVRALQQASYSGMFFVAGFMALFAWQLGRFFKLNKPRRYEPGAPPQALLPRE